MAWIARSIASRRGSFARAVQAPAPMRQRGRGTASSVIKADRWHYRRCLQRRGHGGGLELSVKALLWHE